MAVLQTAGFPPTHRTSLPSGHQPTWRCAAISKVKSVPTALECCPHPGSGLTGVEPPAASSTRTALLCEPAAALACSAGYANQQLSPVS